MSLLSSVLYVLILFKLIDRDNLSEFITIFIFFPLQLNLFNTSIDILLLSFVAFFCSCLVLLLSFLTGSFSEFNI